MHTYMCIYVYIYIYIYTHIHIYIHMLIRIINSILGISGADSECARLREESLILKSTASTFKYYQYTKYSKNL